MPNRLLLAAARRPGLKDFITGHKFTRSVARRFVAGDTLDDALAACRDLNSAGIGAILDYLGENVASEAQADVATRAYLDSLARIASEELDAHISVKPTQLGLNLETSACLARMGRIADAAHKIQSLVAIDMESHEFTDGTIDVYEKLKQTHDDVVLCLQAYLNRTRDDVSRLLYLKPSIRLCKGAYDEPEEISQDRAATRESFKELLATLLASSDYTAVATHDDTLIAETIELADKWKLDRKQFEFQMLYGVRRELQSELVRAGYLVRVYVPFGSEWYAYLMRRLAERPANLRFFAEALVRR